MGVRLIVEVLDNAPDDLTQGERLLLVVLAENANDVTREGWPGMDLIARRTGIQPNSVRKMLHRLSKRGIEVRVPIGKDKNGEPVYAVRGHRTKYHLPAMGRGDDSPPFDPTKGGLSSPDSSEKGGPRSLKGGTTVPDQQAKGGPASLPSPQSSFSPQEEPSSSSGDPHVKYLADKLKIDDDEAERLLQKIKGEKTFNNLGGYLRRIPSEHYNTHLADLRAEAKAEAELPHKNRWCGQCDERTRTITTEKPDGDPLVVPCPNCNWRTLQTTGSLAAALERRDRAQRQPGYRPWRNPTDDSYYDDWLNPPKRRPRDGRDVSTPEELRDWETLANRDDGTSAPDPYGGTL